MLVHWSDWSSQPSVRVACTQRTGMPWPVRFAETPPHVHELPMEDSPESLLYTFEIHLVTCPDCLALESFQQERSARLKVLTQAGWTFPPDHPEGVPPCRDLKYQIVKFDSQDLVTHYTNACKLAGHKVRAWNDPATLQTGYACKTCEKIWAFTVSFDK